jgi:arylsulfatase A-like enzyme
LALASLDAALGMLGAGHHRMHPGLTGLLPLILVAYLAMWVAICAPLVRWGRLHPTPLALGLAAFFLPPVAVLSLGHFVNLEEALAASTSPAGLLQLAVLGSIGLGCAALVYHSAFLLSRSPQAQKVIGQVAHAFALLLFMFAVCIWIHERGTGRKEVAAMSLAPFLICCLILAIAVWRMRWTRPLLIAVHAAAVVSLVAPLWLAAVPRTSLVSSARAAGADPGLVLLITVDTLRRDALSVYSDDARPTPAFDALAGDGIIYENAFASAPWTLPSLASIHTGLPETVHQMTTKRPSLPAGIRTLAQHFADVGYRTAAIGTNPWLAAGDLGRGFERTDFYPKTRHQSAGSKLLGDITGASAEIDLDTEALTDRAVNWIRASAGARSFLWLHYFDPHSPYEPPAELIEGAGDGFRSFAASYRIMNGSWQTTAPEKAQIRRLYEAEVQHVDRNLARIVAELKLRNLYDETLIVIAADHGEEFWDHDTAFHGHTLFDEMVRVPLIVKPPRRERRSGTRIHEAVTTGSVGATMLGLSGIDMEPWQAFFSALPLGPSSAEPAEAQPIIISGTEYFERRTAMVYGNHKLIVHRDSERRELYDLLADPGERCDLAAHEPERVGELLDLLERQQAQALALRVGLGLQTPQEAEISDAVREQLEALGYLQ